MVLPNEFDENQLKITNIWEDDGKTPEADVHYGDSKFCFTLNNVRTLGIEAASRKDGSRVLWLRLCLEEDHQAFLRKFDAHMEMLLFENRRQLLKHDRNLDNIQSPADTKFCYLPLASANKQLNVHVSSLRDNEELVVDTFNCRITNIESKLCDWKLVKRGFLKEVVVEVKKVFYKGTLKFNLQARLIVPMDIGQFYYDGPNKQREQSCEQESLTSHCDQTSFILELEKQNDQLAVKLIKMGRDRESDMQLFGILFVVIVAITFMLFIHSH